MFEKLNDFSLEDATQIAYYLITILTKENVGVYIEYVPHDLDSRKLKIASTMLENMGYSEGGYGNDKLIIDISNYIKNRQQSENNTDIEKGRILLEKMNAI